MDLLGWGEARELAARLCNLRPSRLLALVNKVLLEHGPAGLFPHCHQWPGVVVRGQCGPLQGKLASCGLECSPPCCLS